MSENRTNKDNLEPTIYRFQSGMKNILGKVMAYLIGVLGMLTAFFVSLLSNPQGTIGVVDKISDIWFWVVWAVVFAIAIGVATITYRISKSEAKDGAEFQATLKYYKEKKDKAMEHIDVLDDFCHDKTKAVYISLERELVEACDLNYTKYKNGEYDLSTLEKWQLKKLKKIRKIKVKRIRARDLTQEHGIKLSSTYSFLPEGEKSHERKFILSKAFTRAINTFAFMLVGSLTFSMMGWVSAIVNAFGILMAWIGAVLSAYDFVNTTLRARYIIRADYLDEFNNTVHKYITKPDIKEAETPEIEPEQRFSGSGGQSVMPALK